MRLVKINYETSRRDNYQLKRLNGYMKIYHKRKICSQTYSTCINTSRPGFYFFILIFNSLRLFYP